MSTRTPDGTARASVAPFKEQTPYDPYLPLSEDEEQLHPVSAAQTALGSHDTHQSLAAGNLDPRSAAFAHGGVHLTSAYQGAGRSDTFGLENFEAQGFENPDLFDEHFGPLPQDYDINDMALFRNSSFRTDTGRSDLSARNSNINRSDTGRSDLSQSVMTSRDSRRSTGLATHSSQLMSPVLTDAASPDGMDGPNDKARLLGGGAMSRTSSTSTANAGQGSTSVGRTPAPTTSTHSAAPNIVEQHQSLFPPITPSIQVATYTRGDSPATGEPQNQISQKRRRGSRSSAALANEAATTGIDTEPDTAGRAGFTRDGLEPRARESSAVSSLNEQTEQREVDRKNEHISHWLSITMPDKVDPNHLTAPAGARAYLKPGPRRRAASHSNPAELHSDAIGMNQELQADSHARTPGPGILLHEDSGDEDDDHMTGSYVESAPPSVDGHEAAAKAEELDQFPAHEGHLPEHEAHPWVDPLRMPSHSDALAQPGTSNAAMQRFLRRAQDMETASRVATWGTTPRRMSDGDLDIERIFGAHGFLARLSISKERSHDRPEHDREDWHGFRETMERAAEKIRTKRANSVAKRKSSDSSRPIPEKSQSYDAAPKRKDSSGSSKFERKDSTSSKTGGHHSLLSRIPSGAKRPKSPRINTSGIAAAVTTQIGALGAGSMSPATQAAPLGWRDRARMFGLHHLRQSEEPENLRMQSTPDYESSPHIDTGRQTEVDADDDRDAGDDSQPFSMEMLPTRSNIIPTFDGFKAHVRETNPRLPEWLVERLGQEQLRRYKKLVGFKVEHTRAKELGKCNSGSFCVDRGGQPRYFPAKNMPKQPPGEEDEDDEAVADGIVSEAQFPPGLPLPPAKRLPAQFECPLCFQVKKFQKPSDWSKHVHEDLQPFTCTFSHCADPKSFKRKADWVRHENERHRQLEWWQCSEEGCSHLCYRRDNFVQHLVREHKLPEPQSKNPRPDRPAVRGPAKTKPKAKGFINVHDVPPEERVLYMVEVCRRETNKDPMQEPCRFCGNLCNSFKKLTVHLARHMESLSLPVLALVKAKDVSSDTVISPIDIKLSQQDISPVDPQTHFGGQLTESSFVETLDSNTVPEYIGMAPLMPGAGFHASQYPPAGTWGETHAGEIPQQALAGFAGGMGNPTWPASSGIYDQSVSASYPQYHAGVPYAQHNPAAGADLYGQMTGTVTPPSFHPGSAYPSAQYRMTTPPQRGSVDGLEMGYEGGGGAHFSQPAPGGMYDARMVHNHPRGESDPRQQRHQQRRQPPPPPPQQHYYGQF